MKCMKDHLINSRTQSFTCFYSQDLRAHAALQAHQAHRDSSDPPDLPDPRDLPAHLDLVARGPDPDPAQPPVLVSVLVTDNNSDLLVQVFLTIQIF